MVSFQRHRTPGTDLYEGSMSAKARGNHWNSCPVQGKYIIENTAVIYNTVLEHHRILSGFITCVVFQLGLGNDRNLCWWLGNLVA